jgi:hypothetical protein
MLQIAMPIGKWKLQIPLDWDRSFPVDQQSDEVGRAF